MKCSLCLERERDEHLWWIVLKVSKSHKHLRPKGALLICLSFCLIQIAAVFDIFCALSTRMDPALLRDRELFKKRALSTPAVEKRQAASDSGSHKKKKPKVDKESSSGSKHGAGKWIREKKEMPNMFDCYSEWPLPGVVTGVCRGGSHSTTGIQYQWNTWFWCPSPSPCISHRFWLVSCSIRNRSSSSLYCQFHPSDLLLFQFRILKKHTKTTFSINIPLMKCLQSFIYFSIAWYSSCLYCTILHKL